MPHMPDVPDSLAALQSQRAGLLRKISELSEFRPGSITTTTCAVAIPVVVVITPTPFVLRLSPSKRPMAGQGQKSLRCPPLKQGRLWEEPTEEIGPTSESVGILAASGGEDVKKRTARRCESFVSPGGTR
jgi:hypothetical protein